jgi:hypothetical protein
MATAVPTFCPLAAVAAANATPATAPDAAEAGRTAGVIAICQGPTVGTNTGAAVSRDPRGFGS